MTTLGKTICVRVYLVAVTLTLLFGCASQSASQYSRPEYHGELPAPVPHWTNQPPANVGHP